jgi:hypothetical protein
MKRIGLLSDTHSWIYQGIYNFFEDCDELWHAGDIGDALTLDTLMSYKPVRAVYGNIDGQEIRMMCPEIQVFRCEDVKVVIKHIGGYPGRYDRSVRLILDEEKPDLFISGHSHILKVMYDNKKGLMHLNPGAAGRSGLHHKITCIRFTIDVKDIKELEILEKDRKELLRLS